MLVSSGLLFLYCVGAILAPALAANLMRLYGPATLFAQNGLVHLALAAFTLWRFLVKEAPPPAHARVLPEGPQRPEPGLP
jgi:hypothetical protein